MKSSEESFFIHFVCWKICDTICSRSNCIDKVLQLVKVSVCLFILQMFNKKSFYGTDFSQRMRTFSRSLCYIFFFPFFSNNAPNDHLNSVPLSTHPFFGCFFVIISLNASAIVEAYFHFKGCTLRQQDMKSTATSRYLTSWLYLASLSSLASLFRRYYK